MPGDWRGLITAFPDLVVSLTLLGPTTVDAQSVADLGSRLFVITGDGGPTAENVRAAMARLPDASVVFLPGFMAWPHHCAVGTKP